MAARPHLISRTSNHSGKASLLPHVYLDRAMTESIVGAIVNCGMEDAGDVISVLKELQDMKYQHRQEFYDSVRDMCARGVGKKSGKRGISWNILDKVLAQNLATKTASEAEKSKEQKMIVLS